MKNKSIRFRMSEGEKHEIEDFAHQTGRTMSEILRFAVAEVVRGDVPGTDARRIWADIRRSNNHLLEIMDTKPINVARLRAASIRLRETSQHLARCK